MRSTLEIGAIVVVGLVAWAGATAVEPRVGARVSQQAQAEQVTVLTVEGMT